MSRIFVLLLMFVLFAPVMMAQTPDETLTVAPQVRQPAPPPSPEMSIEELEDNGDGLRGRKYYADAVDYYKVALQKQPSPQVAAVLWNKIGIAELQMVHDKAAMKAFQKAIKLDRSYPEAHNNLGVVEYRRKKYKGAIKNYRRAILLKETQGSFHSNLGTAYFARKEFENAVNSYRRALQLDPDIFDRRSLVGIAAQMSSPEDRAHYSFVLARMFANMGEFDRALIYLKRSMEDGYKDIADVYTDDQFSTLRKDPRFVALMSDKPVSIPQ